MIGGLGAEKFTSSRRALYGDSLGAARTSWHGNHSPQKLVQKGQTGYGSMHEKSIFRTVNRWTSRRRGLAVLCAGTVAAVLAAGCSNSGSGSSAGSTGTASSNVAVSNCVATATAKV